MNIVQQRSRTEGTGSSMGDMNMGGGPVNHAHVSKTLGCDASLKKYYFHETNAKDQKGINYICFPP
jgi:hypothetical protein